MKLFTIPAFVLLFAFAAAAQDPVKVDPEHYKVVFEDTSMRVLRLSYGPHEKSVMHQHPFGSCVIFITEFHGKSTDRDGNVTAEDHKPGEVACEPFRRGLFSHLPENTGDAPFEVILIERKSAQIASVELGSRAGIAQFLGKMQSPPLPEGKSKLAAPVPRTADGKPDLSGLWQAQARIFESVCAENERDQPRLDK